MRNKSYAGSATRDAVWACWGGRLPLPRTGLPPPRISLPHSPVWVFSFEKLRKSAIQYKHIDKKIMIMKKTVN